MSLWYKIVDKNEKVIFERNITDNLSKMALMTPCKLHNMYDFIWDPYNFDYVRIGRKYIRYILSGYTYAIMHRKELEQYNPANGWGSYTIYIDFLAELLQALSQYRNGYTWYIETD